MKPFQDSLLTVITPVYRNAGTLEQLTEEVFRAAKGVFAKVEYIFVNDASPDDSQEVLQKLAARNPEVKVIRLARNFGQHVAIMAGMDQAKGDYILMLDGDLEEPPSAIPRFAEKMKEGHEIVIGKRTGGRPSLFKTLTARIYSHLFNALSSHKIIDNVTNMRLMTRKYVEYLRRFEERPFIGGLTSWIGIPPALIDVDFEDQGRVSSYTLSKMLSHARIGLIGFSVKPLRIAFMFGGAMAGVAILFALINGVRYFLHGNIATGYTSITAIIFLSGLQFVFLGIIGEYVGEIFLQTKGRPRYLTYDTINLDNGNQGDT